MNFQVTQGAGYLYSIRHEKQDVAGIVVNLNLTEKKNIKIIPHESISTGKVRSLKAQLLSYQKLEMPIMVGFWSPHSIVVVIAGAKKKMSH